MSVDPIKCPRCKERLVQVRPHDVILHIRKVEFRKSDGVIFLVCKCKTRVQVTAEHLLKSAALLPVPDPVPAGR